MELPYLCEDEARTKRLVTLSEDEDGKRTAEDRGAVWMITNWEVEEIDGQKYWFDRSGATIGKDEVATLFHLAANDKVSGGGTPSA